VCRGGSTGEGCERGQEQQELDLGAVVRHVGIEEGCELVVVQWLHARHVSFPGDSLAPLTLHPQAMQRLVTPEALSLCGEPTQRGLRQRLCKMSGGRAVHHVRVSE